MAIRKLAFISIFILISSSSNAQKDNREIAKNNLNIINKMSEEDRELIYKISPSLSSELELILKLKKNDQLDYLMNEKYASWVKSIVEYLVKIAPPAYRETQIKYTLDKNFSIQEEFDISRHE